MRSDGRKPNELRNISMQLNFSEFAEGSVLISAVKTKILYNASIEDKIPNWILNQNKEHGWITAEYAMLPRSTLHRIPRETLRPKGRSMEIKRLIGRSLRAAVDLDKLGRRTCIIDCDVIQADGGTRTLSITGGYLALAIALKTLINAGEIPEDTLQTEIAAISAGFVKNKLLLDLNYEEDSNADVDANIVMNGKGEFIEVQCTSEQKGLTRENLDALVNLSVIGIDQIFQLQRKVLYEM